MEVGMKPKLFSLLTDDLGEGSSSVFENLLAKAKDHLVEVKVLGPWADIDTLDDLKIALKRSADQLPSVIDCCKNDTNLSQLLED